MVLFACGSNKASNVCGNGVLEYPETCDTKIESGNGVCPTSCDDGNACTTDTLQEAGTCTATCVNAPITTCVNDDGCCPTGCSESNDNDCYYFCGNGVVETSEKCDIGITAPATGACPSGCGAPNGNIIPTLLNPGTCAAECKDLSCGDLDGYCPIGCVNDNDCNTLVDLTGTWITHINTTGTISVPYVGDINDAVIDIVQRIVITKSNGNINALFEICSLSTTGKTQDTSFSVDYSGVLSQLNTNTTESDFDAYVGKAVQLPDFIINVGQQAPHVNLPVHVGDDKSYIANASVTISTILKNTYLQVANTIIGTEEFSSDCEVFSLDGYTLFHGPLTVTPDSPISVIINKLAGVVSCSDVLTHF
jgi:hypothetical protein